MSPMDVFCGSRFWDYNQTWNTTDPDLSICFQDTVLVWVPCGFLWMAAPFETYFLLKSTNRLIPWTALNLAKLAITFVLFMISLVEFSYAGHAALSEGIALPPVYFYTPFIKLATFLLAGLLLLAGRKRGSQTSATLFFFWFLLAGCGIVAYRSQLRHAVTTPSDDAPDYVKEERMGEPLFFGSFMAYYPLVVIQFLLNCFADSRPIYRQHVLPPEEKECPESGASFLSQLLFSWFDSLAYQGWRRPLETSDLWALNFNDRTDQVVPGFDRHWLKQLAAAQLLRERGASAASAPAGDVAATYHNHANHDGGEVKFSEPGSHGKKMGSSASLPAGAGGGERRMRLSIVRALIQTYGPAFVVGSILKLVHDTLQFVSPQLLSVMIGFVGSGEPAWKGVFYAVLMFVTASIQSLVLSRYFHRMYIVGMRIRTSLISAIYRKSLVLSNAAKKESTTGEIVNLMSNDAQRFMELMVFLNMLWSAPYQIALALYFLWQRLGVAVLSGVGIMVLMVPINGFLAAYSKKLQTRQMKHKDERIKLMNEILGGMKVLKLYAWEPSFQDHVQHIRGREVRNLRRMAYVSGVLSFLWTCAPFLVSLMSFMTYVLISDQNVLDPQRAFVSLTLFHILRFPLSMLPMLISMLVQASVSVKRMNKYLGHEELDEYVTHEKDDVNTPIRIRNGSFAWTKDEEPVLRELDIQVPKGALVAIVGQVGAGKSSLLSALLGDMERIDGAVNVQGSVAYVAQQAWIQNATVRDNILFQRKMERDRYNRTIEQCALQTDLNVLPGGDLTEIGEKGINLSGGQKQRVSLARAVYSDTDIYLLDDPLSAVDSHVGKHIFDHVIGPKGTLRDKTRLLVTHGISYLPQVDQIIVLREGRIEEQGTYQELLGRKGALAELLLHFLREESQDEALLQEDPNLVEDLLLHIASPEISRQLSQYKSTSELSLSERKEFLRSLSRQLSETHSQDSSVPAQAGGPDTANRRSSAGSESMSGRSLSRSQSTLRNVAGDKAPGAQEAGTKLVQAEAAETGRVKWRVYFAYFGAIGAAWMVPIVVMNVASQAFSIGSNLWLTAWSNDPPLPDGSQDIGKRDLRLGVYGALGVGQGVTILLGSLALSLGSLKGAMLLHNGLLHNILRSPMSFFDTTPLGRIVNRFAKDVDTMDLTIPMTVRSWLMCFLQVVSTLLIITLTTPIFLVVAVPVFVLYYLIQAFYVATSRQLKRLESVTRSPIYTHFSETLSGVSTIRAYGAQERFVQESNQRVDHNQMCYYPSTISNRWLAVRLEFCGNLIVLSAALFAVFGSDHLDGGLVGLSLSYALSITSTMNWMVRMSCEFETNIVAVERIMEYTRSPTEAAWEIPEAKPPLEWPQGGEVQFRDYATRYREGLELIIKDITVSVHPGEKVGIVGRTGAGKSSLMLSLFRIVEPAKGTILIDGVDVTKIGLHDLRSKLTIIPQDPVLFSGTVRTNLDPFRSKSDEDIWAALELSHLKAFIAGLEKGLEHEVQEGGENLSVGQRQLLCLARALLRKSKVLVLDEATAAVDLETDALIQQTIRREFAGSTILTIAHRLNTIMDYDRILVLEQGRVAEFDSPANLLAAENSIFHGMAKDAGLA